MDLARRVASLGLSARSNAGLKVRQPLSKVLVHVGEGQAELSEELVDIVADELNIKIFADGADLPVPIHFLSNPEEFPLLLKGFKKVSVIIKCHERLLLLN